MNASFVVMGLPESGKTTFLAALWHLIESDETECSLVLDGYEGDLTYLNQIAEAWRSFNKVPRTSQVGSMTVSFNLKNRATGVRGTALFPDLAGEVFDQQVIERRCRPDFVTDVSEGDGILFFISANVAEDTLSVVELNARLRIPEHEAGDDEARLVEGKQGSEQRLAWQPQNLPKQVKIVQILSDLLRRPFEQQTRRMAILISAWDLAAGMNLTPREWLAKHMPLVDQFLRTNAALFQHEIFGISAQGTSLENAEAVIQVAKLPTPSNRVQIVGPNSTGHDITFPLIWLMSVQE
ncbi:hypothetical protein [Pseudomonas sp. ME-P-057]|uniref:TRAFAC clade GTPase domain-containing protein n=1 Tax=Pseudomonas sp. ME-P-057 TaxID=3040321 RepID=UPI00255356B3|nr:hypothetical protein [Pseudomonas sp. ME-P-057]